MRDSNPRMSAPKADALPLGESPMDSFFLFGGKNLIILPYLGKIVSPQTCKVVKNTNCIHIYNIAYACYNNHYEPGE